VHGNGEALLLDEEPPLDEEAVDDLDPPLALVDELETLDDVLLDEELALDELALDEEADDDVDPPLTLTDELATLDDVLLDEELAPSARASAPASPPSATASAPASPPSAMASAPPPSIPLPPSPVALPPVVDPPVPELLLEELPPSPVRTGPVVSPPIVTPLWLVVLALLLEVLPPSSAVLLEPGPRDASPPPHATVPAEREAKMAASQGMERFRMVWPRDAGLPPPVNTRPKSAQCRARATERERLARVCGRGRAASAGGCLPRHHDKADSHSSTSRRARSACATTGPVWLAQPAYCSSVRAGRDRPRKDEDEPVECLDRTPHRSHERRRRTAGLSGHTPRDP
jgi:hypothetical protein